MIHLFLLILLVVCVDKAFSLPKQFDEPTNRIFGGEQAPDGGVPYQASLRSNSNSHFCGGSIISDRWILTAAHCTIRKSKYSMNVVVGTNLLSSGGVKYSVDKIRVHEGYDGLLLINDVSVVKVSEEIIFNEMIQPIQLPDEDTMEGATLVATGWGRTSLPGNFPDKLQTINLTALSVDNCKKYYRIIVSVYDTQICTLTKMGEGVCQGDSGSPLVEGDRVVGIVSWGLPCGLGFPDVYSRVYAFKDWIEEKMNTL